MLPHQLFPLHYSIYDTIFYTLTQDLQRFGDKRGPDLDEYVLVICCRISSFRVELQTIASLLVFTFQPESATAEVFFEA